MLITPNLYITPKVCHFFDNKWLIEGILLKIFLEPVKQAGKHALIGVQAYIWPQIAC